MCELFTLVPWLEKKFLFSFLFEIENPGGRREERKGEGREEGEGESEEEKGKVKRRKEGEGMKREGRIKDER